MKMYTLKTRQGDNHSIIRNLEKILLSLAFLFLKMYAISKTTEQNDTRLSTFCSNSCGNFAMCMLN